MKGKRLFGGGPAETEGTVPFGEVDEDPGQTRNELFQYSSNGLPNIQVGTGPYKLVLDSASKNIVPQPMAERDYFLRQFENIEKIGEGQFGIAYRVKCRSSGLQWAVKKQKEEYMGVRDRDLRRQEVAKAFQICSVHE